MTTIITVSTEHAYIYIYCTNTGWNLFGKMTFVVNFIVKATLFRGDSLRGEFSKTLKMFFFSVSDVLCAISVMQPTWTVVLCCTPFPTLRHDRPREKSAHAWYRMVHDQNVSSSGDPYHKVLTHSLNVLFWSFFLKERKGQITMFFSLFFVQQSSCLQYVLCW